MGARERLPGVLDEGGGFHVGRALTASPALITGGSVRPAIVTGSPPTSIMRPTAIWAPMMLATSYRMTAMQWGE